MNKDSLTKLALWIAADLVVLLHAAIVFVIFFGWLFPEISYIYFGILIATLASWVMWGGCLLTKWEFRLRAWSRPSIQPYQDSFLIYYAAKILGDNVPRYGFLEKSAYSFWPHQ